MLDPTPETELGNCLIGIREHGLMHCIRLVLVLTPLIKHEPYHNKPLFDLKLLFNEQRILFENAFRDDAEHRAQAKETCDKLDGIFLQRWEGKCEEMGWHDFDNLQFPGETKEK